MTSFVCPIVNELASIFNDECTDLIRLFLLKCGLLSKLWYISILPSLVEIDETRLSIFSVIVYGGLYSSIKSPHLAYYLAYHLTIIIYLYTISIYKYPQF